MLKIFIIFFSIVIALGAFADGDVEVQTDGKNWVGQIILTRNLISGRIVRIVRYYDKDYEDFQYKYDLELANGKTTYNNAINMFAPVDKYVSPNISRSNAWGKIEHENGGEIEFVTKAIEDAYNSGKSTPTPGMRSMWAGFESEEAAKFAQAVHAKCMNIPGCQKREEHYKYKDKPEFLFTFQDGFWIRVSYDPYVVEIQMQKENTADLRKHRDLVEELVFQTAKENGFYIRSDNAGHFNRSFDYLSRSSDSAFRLLSYISFFENYAELWLGGMGYFPSSAAPLSARPERMRNAFLRLINTLSHKYLKPGTRSYVPGNYDGLKLLENVVKFLYSSVYSYYSPEELTKAKEKDTEKAYKKKLGVNTDYRHDLAVNIDSLYDNFVHKSDKAPWLARIEYRGIMSQASADAFIAQGEFFDAVYNFIDKNGNPLIYLARNVKEPTYELIISRFYALCQDIHFSFDKNRQYILTPEFQDYQPDDFITGKKFFMKTEEDFQTVKAHLIFLPISPHTRHIVSSILTSKKAQKSRWIVPLIKEITNLSIRYQKTDSYLSKFFADFLISNALTPENVGRLMDLDPNQQRTKDFERRMRSALGEQKYNQMRCSFFFQ